MQFWIAFLFFVHLIGKYDGVYGHYANVEYERAISRLCWWRSGKYLNASLDQGRNNTPRSKEAFELDEKGGKKVILSKGGKN